jgi:hypothetical protein
LRAKIIRKDPKSIVTIFSSELARALSELSQTKIADIEAFKKADRESGEEGTDAIERTEIEELA